MKEKCRFYLCRLFVLFKRTNTFIMYRSTLCKNYIIKNMKSALQCKFVKLLINYKKMKTYCLEMQKKKLNYDML